MTSLRLNCFFFFHKVTVLGNDWCVCNSYFENGVKAGELNPWKWYRDHLVLNIRVTTGSSKEESLSEYFPWKFREYN